MLNFVDTGNLCGRRGQEMRLVKFTLVGDNNAPVYVNPDHVVSVTPFAKYTSILTTCRSTDAKEFRINVKEALDTVVSGLMA
jgi:hypothetical protein